jgi:hypothetical protein
VNLLERVYRDGGFNPALPVHELAETHIPLDRFGIHPGPERRLLDAACQTDGIAILEGPSGAGKSSILAYVAQELSCLSRGTRRFVPLYVPVAARAEQATDLSTFGRMAIANLLSSFEDLPKDRSRRLRAHIATTITTQSGARAFNAKLIASAPLGFELGASIQGEIRSITRPGGIEHDPLGGLELLAGTLRGLERELVIFVEDTDGWVLASEDHGCGMAERFFGRVLGPLSSPDFAILVAAQSHWAEVGSFKGVSDRAVAHVRLDAQPELGRARGMVTAIVRRRVEWATGDPCGDIHNILEPPAVDILARQLVRHGSMRKVLTVLRDTLGHVHDHFPDRIGAGHLLEAA